MHTSPHYLVSSSDHVARRAFHLSYLVFLIFGMQFIYTFCMASLDTCNDTMLCFSSIFKTKQLALAIQVPRFRYSLTFQFKYSLSSYRWYEWTQFYSNQFHCLSLILTNKQFKPQYVYRELLFGATSYDDSETILRTYATVSFLRV